MKEFLTKKRTREHMSEKTIRGKITGIAVTGSFELEGHSVIFTAWKNDENQIKIRESFRGNSW